jgi:hypothetical protein
VFFVACGAVVFMGLKFWDVCGLLICVKRERVWF